MSQTVSLRAVTIIAATCGTLALAQVVPEGTYKLALSQHKGQLTWAAPGFKITQNSAKPLGREIGVRAKDDSGQLSFLGFLFLVPEGAPLTNEKCRDGALDPEKKNNPRLKILETSEIPHNDGLPVSLVSYESPTRDGSIQYVVRGFVATADICGDLAFYSRKQITTHDANFQTIFASFQLNPGYVPVFGDVTRYAQVLYQSEMYVAAAPIFERALTILPSDGAPFPSAKIARRVVRDQTAMSYVISGAFAKARQILETGVAEDPEYPLYYYNLACADAGEKNLADARRHLKQAFERKANVNAGETMPDPTHDDSFLPYRADKDFWSFVERLQAGK